jgi:tyrosine-protein kinase Etk/Wzc
MNNYQDFFNDKEEEQSIDYKSIIFKYFSYLSWYILAIILSLFTAYIYLKYQPNIYEAKTSILVKKDPSNPLSNMEGFSDMFSQKDQLEDEIELIRSLPVLTAVVKELKLNINYSFKSNLSKRNLEYYKNAPIEVLFFNQNELFDNVSFVFKKLNNNTFEITYNDVTKKYNFNDRIVLNEYSTVTISKTSYFKDYTNEIIITIQSYENTALSLLQNIKTEPASAQSNAINIIIKSTNLDKSKDILNELNKQYFKNSVEDKKATITNTIDFIKERIILLDSEIKKIENEIKNYKQQNKLTDLITESQIFAEKAQNINQSVFDAELQLNLVKSINQKISKNNLETLPVNQGFTDQSINVNIAKYNDFIVKYKTLSNGTTELNPERKMVEKQLKELKQSITEALNNQRNVLELTVNKVKNEKEIVDSKLKMIPSQEKEMREINREHLTKEALFIYLLKKREELAISQTSLTPNARIINYAYGSNYPIAPKKSAIYLMFFAIGIIVPTIIIYIIQLLDSKLHTVEDLEKKSLIPNIGIVPKFHELNRTLLEVNDRSSTAEALRLVITNIEFILSDFLDCKTILATSTIAGEGKSFVSANMASYLAHSGKKVIILGFDLRAPKLHEFFSFKNPLGITHFIKNHEIKIEEIITSIQGYDKFDLIHSGIVVPNFVELMKNSKIEELFTYLKQNYDYIIIDSAPVGLVSDTLNLAKYTDLCLFVVKAHFLEKNMLSISNKLLKENKFKNIKSILNAVDIKKSSYGYGYGYGYGQRTYGYGNDIEDINSKFKLKPWTKGFYKYWFNL